MPSEIKIQSEFEAMEEGGGCCEARLYSSTLWINIYLNSRKFVIKESEKKKHQQEQLPMVHQSLQAILLAIVVFLHFALSQCKARACSNNGQETKRKKKYHETNPLSCTRRLHTS